LQHRLAATVTVVGFGGKASGMEGLEGRPFDSCTQHAGNLCCWQQGLQGVALACVTTSSFVHRSCILCPSHVFFFAYCPCRWSRPEERKGRKRPTGLGIEKARSATPKRPNRPTTPSSFVSGPVAITSTSYHLHLHPRDWAGAEHLNDD